MIDFRKYFDAAYLINLNRRSDRLRESEAELQKYNICGVERVEAVDGKTLPPHNKISLGALGLYHTHWQIIKYAKEQGFKNVLILEDDIELRPQILQFDEYMQSVPEPYALVYCGAHHIQQPIKISDKIVKNVQAFTTHAIGIHSRIFDRILKDFENIGNMDFQVDLYYSEIIQKEYDTYSFFPNVITQRKSFSDIEMCEKDYSDNMDENLNI